MACKPNDKEELNVLNLCHTGHFGKKLYMLPIHSTLRWNTMMSQLPSHTVMVNRKAICQLNLQESVIIY